MSATKSGSASSSGSGAGPRAIGTTSGKKKTKPKSAAVSASAAAAFSSPTSSSVPPPDLYKVDHFSPASAADKETMELNAQATKLAQQSAFPLLHSDYNPEDDVVEDVDEQKLLEEQMAELMKEETINPRPLTLEIIRQQALPAHLLESGNQELINKKLFKMERLYLDGQGINSIDDTFDVFSHCLTHLYLQRNFLTTTAGFSCLRKLQFLSLAKNEIRTVEGLDQLENLVFLDLSDNLIEVLDTGSEDDEDSVCQLPVSLVVLNVKGNPFVEESIAANMGSDLEYVQHIVTVSPYLKRLDDKRITNAMRREWGLEADSDDDDTDFLSPATTATTDDTAEGQDGEEDEEGNTARSAKSTARSQVAEEDEEEDDDDDEDDDEEEEEQISSAAAALRAQTEEMRQRSQQRTMLYDTKHGVTQATTAADREEAITKLMKEEAAASRKVPKK